MKTNKTTIERITDIDISDNVQKVVINNRTMYFKTDKNILVKLSLIWNTVNLETISANHGRIDGIEFAVTADSDYSLTKEKIKKFINLYL